MLQSEDYSVREAVFSIDSDSVAGPDRFGAVFFHACWEIIFKDVFGAVTEFFRGVKMPKGFTATSISLIPKTASPTCWSEYRLINLCNVTNKICTKLMTILLGHVLPKVISLSQSGFVPGRLLSDNVLLAQELVHSLESRRPDANVVFKLDMAKAYDRVSWEFLYQVLRRKGFPQHWIDLVANAISHCWFSVLVNGEHAGFFHSTRGLRQGDPLSPALFVLAADYLSRGLERLFAAHPTMFYQAPGLIRVSHLAYADDLMIFTTTCLQNIELLRDFLRAYERVSGQLINGLKSSFIVGRQASSQQTQAVQDVLAYQLKHLPVKYLGVPLYKGNKKTCLFDPIISRLRDLLQGWAMTNLSHGGRLALIRSVLQATPLHLLQEYLHGRYCRNLHPTIVPYNRNHSSISHRLCRIRDVAEPFIFWTLGEGSVFFWHDNWFGEKPLAQLLHRDTYTMEPVSYYWHEGDWNVPRILRIIPMPFAQTICQIPIAAGQGDKIVWTGSSTGDFSTKSAWEAIRQASPRRQLLADVWHHSLRPTISVFLWRPFQDRIPVDARMRQKGFSFPSKYQCCEVEETISHLFIESAAVQGMWQHFATIFGLCLCDTGSLTHMLHFWRYSTPFHSDLHIRTLIPFLILWFTWTQRNAAKYRGLPFSTDGIILEVQRHLRTLYEARTLMSTQWKGDLHQAAIMGFIFRQQVPRAPSIVRWCAPSPSWFKLNTDGSSLGNPGLAGAAGIIRDSAGHVQLAYQFALGTGTSVLARAHCCLGGDGACPDPRSCPLGGGGGCHDGDLALEVPCFWEVGADHLAKEAASLQLTRVLHHGDITGVLRGILSLDRQGVPHLR
ncbi:UNVERIFIED_CONTAM: putative ribonuclease H protein [Sesamum radiatum]|uniref:Ribonuclease H protein n=1 Tax=Sesamum radiatum TaxID=300843 RepID=A0AAW2M2V9_SESRA